MLFEQLQSYVGSRAYGINVLDRFYCGLRSVSGKALFRGKDRTTRDAGYASSTQTIGDGNGIISLHMINTWPGTTLGLPSNSQYVGHPCSVKWSMLVDTIQLFRNDMTDYQGARGRAVVGSYSTSFRM